MKLLSLFTILFCQLAFSQSISIEIFNEEGKRLENINVQLLENNKIVAFQTTDKNGICKFVINQTQGNFSLKITSLLYKEKFLDINPKEKIQYSVTVQSQITEIKEVIIKSRPKIINVKEDTISYNIKSIRDGTERTTEDLVKKLPGLDVNEDGKITHKGNAIGQVLVDGNELFGKNHKIATQNISADMLEGIDLWQNYTTISGNQSTALNLKLKEQYKGKITGNIDGLYGNKNSYLIHANIFKFSKSGNLAFIGDLNSIAKDPINIIDFFEMNKNDNISNMETTTQIETPSFLNNDGKTTSKHNQFGALQYSKASKSFSITAFFIINNAKLNKFSTLRRTAYIGQPSSFNIEEIRSESNDGFLGTSQIKLKKTFKDKSFLFYNLGYTPTVDNFNQSIIRNSSEFEIKNLQRNSNIENFLSWDKEINKNSSIVFSFTKHNTVLKSNFNISSSDVLFQTEYNNLSQNVDITSDKYKIDFFLKNKFQWANINLHSSYLQKKENAFIEEVYTKKFEIKTLETSQFLNELSIVKKVNTFDISSSLSSYSLNLNGFTRHYIEKSFKLKFSPKNMQGTNIGIEYANRFKSPEFRQFMNEKIYNRNLSSIQNFSLMPEILINVDSYKFNFNSFNFNKGNLLFAVLMYEKANGNFTTNIKNYGIFSENLNVLGRLNKRWFLLISDERKINDYLSLKSKITNIYSMSDNFIDNITNQTTLNIFELSQKLRSNFKKIPFQFDLGYTYILSNFKQSLFSTTSQEENIKFSIGLGMNLKKEWIVNILGEYLIQKTPQNSLKNFLVGGQLSYKKENSSFEYNILLNNILNLNSFKYINNSVSQLGTEEYSITALHGYIMGGLKYNF